MFQQYLSGNKIRSISNKTKLCELTRKWNCFRKRNLLKCLRLKNNTFKVRDFFYKVIVGLIDNLTSNGLVFIKNCFSYLDLLQNKATILILKKGAIKELNKYIVPF